MARYIDADKIHEFVDAKVAEGKDGWAKGVPYEWAYALTVIDMQPTADVVPKSEVVLASSDAVKMLIDCHGYALTHDADIKEEVAREIFEEIEKLSYYAPTPYDDEINVVDYEDIAELKKKYTENIE
jgi:hypothetical protein